MAYGDLKVNNLIYDTGSGDATRSVVSIPQIASPTFTGTPAAPTAAANTNTTQIATTAFVMTELGDYLLTATAASTYAPLAAPAFTGTATGVNLTLSGNLTVNGTTTTIDTTTLDVEDKNITLGKVSSPSDTTADGGGITLKGATDKTFNWVDATDAWTSSEHIHLGDDKELKLGTDSDFKIYHNGSHNVIAGRHASADLYIQTNDDTIFEKVDSSGANAEVLAKFISDGGCELYHDNTKKIETTAAGVTVSGSVTDDKGNVRSIPSLAKSSAHTISAANAGKAVYISTGGVTVPNSVMSAGDAVTIVNNSGSDQTITQGSGVTLYNTADAATGNRTLAGRGMATIWFASASVAYISGAGLS